MRATLCLAIATPSNAMPLLCSATPCSALAELFNAMPSPSCSMLCLAVAMLCCALPCRCCAHLRCAMPSLSCSLSCSAVACLCPALPCNATPLLCSAALCLALARLISFWQYADFLSACVRLPADLFRVKRLADRAFLHLADYVPPLDTVGHCVSPLSTPPDGVCRVFAPLGM